MAPETELKNLKKNLDDWIKDINAKIENNVIEEDDIMTMFKEIDLNYDLIVEMRTEIKILKDEVHALRMIQLLHLKADVKMTPTK